MEMQTPIQDVQNLMEEITQKDEIIRQLKNLVAPLEARIKRLEGVIKLHPLSQKILENSYRK